MPYPRPLLAAVLVVAGAGGVAGACSNAPDPPTSARDQDDLSSQTGTRWHVDRDARGTARVMFPVGVARPDRAALDDDDGASRVATRFVDRYRALLGIEDPRRELSVRDVVVDGEGGTRAVRFRQRARGLAVEGGELAVHFSGRGSIVLVTNHYARGALAAASRRPSLDADAARERALDDARTRFPRVAKKGVSATEEPELVVYPTSLDDAALAFDLRLRAGGYELRYLVDARSGRVLLADDGVRDETTPPKAGDVVEGRGVTLDGKTRDLAATFIREVQVDGQALRLHALDHVATEKLAAAGAQRATDTGTEPVESFSAVDWGPESTPAGVDEADAITAYAYLQDSHAYFLERFGRRSYDGSGAKLSFVTRDDTSGADNAFWSGAGTFHFGTGNLQRCLDVVAHELTHAVTQYGSNLTYQGEPGALNESMSDVFGAFVEHRYAPRQSNTVMGEDVRAIRDLGEPSRFQQPDFVEGTDWVDTSDAFDHGGVHINSGIPNNAWYLMTLGGTNKTSKREVKSDDAIGWSASETLWFASNTSLFSASTSFREAALAQIAYTKSSGLVRPSDPAGTCAERGPARVRAVACAWYAVGAIDFVELIEEAKSDAEREDWCAMMEGCKGPKDELPRACESGEAGKTSITVGCESNDGGAPPAGGGEAGAAQPAQGDGRDSCVGREDGVYCSEIVPSSSIVCEGQQIAGGIQCLPEQRCVGPNGPGKEVQCR